MGKTSDTLWRRFRVGMRFTFGELFDDISKWLVIGILLAGVITVFVSPEFIDAYLGDGFLSMVIMLVIAIPLYVCATSSTPIAAALAFKGLSPGAALVFLMAGPATNIASLTVISKVIGKRATVIYLLSIIVCSLSLGGVVNVLYGYLGLDISGWIQGGVQEGHGWGSIVSAVTVIVLVLRTFLPQSIQRTVSKKITSRPERPHTSLFP